MLFLRRSLNFEQVCDSIGVVQNEASLLSFFNLRARLPVSSNARAHEAVVILPLLEELPEAFFASVVALDRLGKVPGLLVAEEDLLRL